MFGMCGIVERFEKLEIARGTPAVLGRARARAGCAPR
jgi:hypothetical protein